MKASIVLFFLAICSMAYAQTTSDTIQAADTLASQVLNEVTVEAKQMVKAGDHMNLYLSEENRKFGTNALDAISTMPLFNTTLNATSLTSWDRKDVFILINGVPSTAMALRSYKADMIKKVEYYQNAPAQYMMFTSGPLVNVEIKKVHDRLYTGYFNTKNAVTMGYGNNQGSLSFQDSLNMVRVNYYGNYSNSSKIRNNSYYDYKDLGILTKYDGRSHQSWGGHNLKTTYQRYQGSHLFNAEVGYNVEPAKNRESRSVHIETPTEIYDGEGENLLENNSKNLSLSLYYNYRFKNNATLAFNVVNSLGWSHSESGQWLTGNGSSLIEDYDTHSHFKNRTYALSAQGFFVKPNVIGGRFQIGAQYIYKHLNQHSLASDYSNRSDQEHITIGECWFSPDGQNTFYPVVGAQIETQRFLGESRTRVNPYARFYGDWWGKGKAQGMTVQLTATVSYKVPSLADLSIGKTYIDPWFVSSGNPELKSYWGLNTKLTLAYFASNSSNRVALNLVPAFRHRPYVPVITKNGDQMVLRPENIKNSREFHAYLNASWTFFKWLKLQPYLEYDFQHFHTPANQIKWDNWRAGCSIITSFGDFESSFHINMPTKEWDGDILHRGSFQCALIAQYKIANWAFGAEYHFSGHNDYKRADIPGFSYFDNYRYMHHYKLVEVTAVYSFSVGKARNHASKMIYDSVNETGLNKYNSVDTNH